MMVIRMIRPEVVLFFVAPLLHCTVTSVFGNEPKIVIVGAGAAGIAAASKLLENGLSDVTILEAEDRIGGRVYTTKFGDYWVDLGGQWVHGDKNNAAFDLAWPLGLLEHSDPLRYLLELYLPTGEIPLNKEQSKNLTHLLLELDEGVAQYIDKDKFETLGDGYRKALDIYFNAHPEIAPYKNAITYFFELVVISGESSMSWDDSVWYGDWELDGDKGINWKDRGYSTILDILMKKYPDPTKELPVMEKTKLNTEVVKIDYTDMNEKVKVHTKNGETYEADHVIVTPSLGVMKATHETLFEPQLSHAKKNYIENYGFGSVSKIYLLFDHPWWIKEGNDAFGLYILWTDEERAKLANDPNKSWQLSVFGFIQVEHKPNLLCAWLAGKGAIEMEKVPEEELMKQTTEMLQMFGKNYNVTNPVKILRTQWHSNDHFRGTYSYDNVNAVKNRANKTAYMEPITPENSKIQFAGETTHFTKYSTVHGAIETGWREAERLLKLHKKL